MELHRKMIFDGDEMLSVRFQVIDFHWLGTH